MRPIHTVLSDGEWSGRRCFVVGSGPSMKNFDYSLLADELTIGCNEEYLFGPTIAICQDVRFFRGDGSRKGAKDNPRWYSQKLPVYFKAHPHRADIPDVPPNVIIAQSNLREWSRSLKDGLAYGANVGLAALNLADILGASPIYLLGFDCNQGPNGESHHHSSYPDNWRIKDKPSSEKRYDQWAEEFRRYAPRISGTVVNMCRESRIDCFVKTGDGYEAHLRKYVHGRLP